MKRMVGIALAAVLVALSWTSLTFAAGKKQITGEVVSVNQTMKTMVVSVQGQEVAFTVEEKPSQALAALKPGDKVTVQYIEAGGTRIAQAITKS